MHKLLKSKTFLYTILVVASVLGSSIINAHYREIQEFIHDKIANVYEINKPVGEALYKVNNFIFNGNGFDLERKNKNVIFTNYQKTALISVQSVVPNMGGGIGTGFFVKVDENAGWLMTNYHVVAAAIEQKDLFKTTVILSSEHWDYEAEIVGYDYIIDIAIIKINKKDNEEWEAFEFADPEEISEGDPIAILGHGLSLPWTATFGQVTFDGRSTKPYNLMLQVDAVINQGNSGGPVIGMNGKIYGVSESILSPGRPVPGWDGVGFAVHARQAKRSMDYIMSEKYAETGHVPYVDLVVPMKSFEYDDVKDIPREERYYVYVDLTTAQPDAVFSGVAAGLQQGDVILEMNGKKISSAFQVIRECIHAMPGDVMHFKILRNNQATIEKEILDIEVVLTEVDYEKLVNAIGPMNR